MLPLHAEFLAEKIYQAAKHRNQVRIALAMNVDSSSLSQWLSGERKPRYGSLQTISRYVYAELHKKPDKTLYNQAEQDFIEAVFHLRERMTGDIRVDVDTPHLVAAFLKRKQSRAKQGPSNEAGTKTGADGNETGEPLPSKRRNTSGIADKSGEIPADRPILGSGRVHERGLDRQLGKRSARAISGAPAVRRLHPTFPKIGTLDSSHQYGREEFKQVKDYLLSGPSKSASLTAAVHGAGGYGKTAIAEELCLDSEVKGHFPGGIYWLQFSMQETKDGEIRANQTRPVSAIIQEMLKNQGYDSSETEKLNIESVEDLLDLLPDEPLLMIADDLWEVSQSNWAQKPSVHASALVTTRNQALAKTRGKPFLIDRLTPTASYKLLTDGMEDLTGDQEARLKGIADGFKGWPLLIKMANAKFKEQHLQDGEELEIILSEYEEFLGDEKITGWDVSGVNNQKAHEKRRQLVGLCIEAGLDALIDDDERSWLRTFGVFPDDTDIPFSVISDFWGELTKNRSEDKKPNGAKCRELLRMFNRYSFFRDFNPTAQTLRLHDEILAYFRHVHEPTERQELHRDLVASIQTHCSTDWASLEPGHNYGWTKLLYHLEQQGLSEKADELRTDFAWLKAKLKAVGLSELEASFPTRNSSVPHGLKAIQRAIGVSAHVLRRRPQSFAHQMFGRLGHRAHGPLNRIVEAARNDFDFNPDIAKPHLLTPGAEFARLMDHEIFVKSAVFANDGERIVTASADKTAKLWDGRTGALIATLNGHKDVLSSAVFSADSERIVTASFDKTARLWDAKTGAFLTALDGHGSSVTVAEFSPDGGQIVTASYDRTARLWDGKTGSLITTLEGHKGKINGAEFSPDGGRIVTASDDRTARLWDGKTGSFITTLEGHKSSVNSAKFSPNGEHIVTASDDRAARLWDGKTGSIIATLEGHQGCVVSAEFSCDNQHITTASNDETARLWDGTEGRLIATLEGHEASVNSSEFSPDGERIVTASTDKTARLWDGRTGAFITTLDGHEAGLFSAKFSPEGQRIVTASADGSARLWDSWTGSFTATLEGHEDRVNSAEFSPDGERIVTASDDRTARLWDGKKGSFITSLEGHEDRVNSAEFSPDGERIVTASDDRAALLWDGRTGSFITALEGHKSSVNSAKFSPNGERIVTASDDRAALLWDGRTGSFITALEGHKSSVNSAKFSPNGERIVTASDDSTARLWDGKKGSFITSLEGHEDRVNSAEFSPDGERIVTGSLWGKTIGLWDGETGSIIATLEGHGGWVYSAVFSRNGQRIVTTSYDKIARLWNGRTGSIIATLEGHEGSVISAKFSPNGERIVTTSKDRTARLWDGKTGSFIAALEGHEGWVHLADFSLDGRRVITASKDGSVQLWDGNLGSNFWILDFDATLSTACIGTEIGCFGLSNGQVIFLNIEPINPRE